MVGESIGMGVVGALVVLIRLWVSRHVPRHFDDSHDPITIDLKPDRFEVYLPQPDRLYSDEELPSLSPKVIAALWYAHELRPQQLVTWAVTRLENGDDGLKMIRLAGDTSTTQRDLENLPDQVFTECGLLVPWRNTQSITVLSRDIAERVLQGKLEPSKAALSISRLHRWEAEGLQKEIVSLNLVYELVLAKDPIADIRPIDNQVREACANFLTHSNLSTSNWS